MEEGIFRFPQEVQDAALRQAVQAGDIPRGTPLKKIRFHHCIPQEIGRREKLPRDMMTSTANCLPLLDPHHVDLHRFFTNDQLAAQNPELLESMRRNKARF